MKWEEILKGRKTSFGVDLTELNARIRAEAAEQEAGREKKRREDLGLPEEDVDDGVILKYWGKCPKCGMKVDKNFNIISKSNIKRDPAFNPRGRPMPKTTWLRPCPYFKKAGKMKGKYRQMGLSYWIVEGQATDDSAADECPMAAPEPTTHDSKTRELWQGPTSPTITVPNPDYDPSKKRGEF